MHKQIKAPATRALGVGEKLGVAIYAGEMPRERLARLGSKELKDEELLAVDLDTGYKRCYVRELALEIIADVVVETPVDMELDQLSQIKGPGKAEAGVLFAGFELARRGLHKGLGTRPVFAPPPTYCRYSSRYGTSSASTSSASTSMHATRSYTRK